MYSSLKGKKREKAGVPATSAAPSAQPADPAPSRPTPRRQTPKRREWKTNAQSSSILALSILPQSPTDKSQPNGDKREVGYIKQLIQYCVEARERGDRGMVKVSISNLRDRIHTMELFPGVTLLAVKESKVLEERGLKIIFGGDHDELFPWDIRADANALYLRWFRGDVDGSLLRGIVVKKNTHSSGTVRTSKSLVGNYKHKRDANVVGENGLINGQWWPDRRCVWRDGGHGSLEAGIYGDAKKGAYSIVVSSSYYADKDDGVILEYCGTESPDEKPTRYTKMLQESFALRTPIRVIRAAKKGSNYAPKVGYRYDGLYVVTDEEVLNPDKHLSRSTLRRKRGQDPIRYEGVEARPNKYEITEHTKIKELLQY